MTDESMRKAQENAYRYNIQAATDRIEAAIHQARTAGVIPTPPQLTGENYMLVIQALTTQIKDLRVALSTCVSANNRLSPPLPLTDGPRPIRVPDHVPAEAADLIYGEQYGVDWAYAEDIDVFPEPPVSTEPSATRVTITDSEGNGLSRDFLAADWSPTAIGATGTMPCVSDQVDLHTSLATAVYTRRIEAKDVTDEMLQAGVEFICNPDPNGPMSDAALEVLAANTHLGLGARLDALRETAGTYVGNEASMVAMRESAGELGQMYPFVITPEILQEDTVRGAAARMRRDHANGEGYKAADLNRVLGDPRSSFTTHHPLMTVTEPVKVDGIELVPGDRIQLKPPGTYTKIMVDGNGVQNFPDPGPRSFQAGDRWVPYYKDDTPTRICFYEQEHYYGSNFSAFRVYWQGQDFDTVEHAYHWDRFDHPIARARELQLEILKARSPHDAMLIAYANKEHQRFEWDSIKVTQMFYIKLACCQQHPYIQQKLKQSYGRMYVEDAWRDDFWGWGEHQDGVNVMGRIMTGIANWYSEHDNLDVPERLVVGPIEEAIRAHDWDRHRTNLGCP